MTTQRPAPRRRLRILTSALLLAAVTAGVQPRAAAALVPARMTTPDPGPTPVLAADPLPACTVGDDAAPFGTASRWRSTFLDTRYRLPRAYVPPGLVSTARAGMNGGSLVRRLVVDDLAAMVRAARRAGVTLRVSSAYRSYREQVDLWRASVARLGREEASRVVARPGHSEHQLGTALDIASTAGAYAWLAAKAWRFGFIVSYPKGGLDVTCYRFEPWHVRYYGRVRAAAIHASGLAAREWLWVHVVDVPR